VEGVGLGWEEGEGGGGEVGGGVGGGGGVGWLVSCVTSSISSRKSWKFPEGWLELEELILMVLEPIEVSMIIWRWRVKEK